MENSTGENVNNIKNLTVLNDELENYFRNTVIPQLFVDAGFILRKFTPPAMTHFNLSLDDIGKHIDEVSHNIRYPTIMKNIEEVVESKQDLEKEIQTTDKKWYQMNILPYLVKKDNKANGVIITFVEITNRIDALKRYEKLNKQYENIFYSVSHDLKGPLSNLDGLIKLLKNLPDDNKEDFKLLINMLDLSLKNLHRTVDDLVEVNIDNTGFTELVERVNFENIIEDVQLALKDKIFETNAKVTTEFLISEVKFARKNIRSIIYNLLSNAIKYKALV